MSSTSMQGHQALDVPPTCSGCLRPTGPSLDACRCPMISRSLLASAEALDDLSDGTEGYDTFQIHDLALRLANHLDAIDRLLDLAYYVWSDLRDATDPQAHLRPEQRDTHAGWLLARIHDLAMRESVTEAPERWLERVSE